MRKAFIIMLLFSINIISAASKEGNISSQEIIKYMIFTLIGIITLIIIVTIFILIILDTNKRNKKV